MIHVWLLIHQRMNGLASRFACVLLFSCIVFFKIIVVGAYMIASAFFSVYNMAIDTVFLSFCKFVFFFRSRVCNGLLGMTSLVRKSGTDYNNVAENTP